LKRRRALKWLKALKRWDQKRKRNGKVSFLIIEPRVKNLSGCFPSVRDADLDISWQITETATPVVTVASHDTRKPKRASDTAL
jgi:hypothetical protein